MPAEGSKRNTCLQSACWVMIIKLLHPHKFKKLKLALFDPHIWQNQQCLSSEIFANNGTFLQLQFICSRNCLQHNSLSFNSTVKEMLSFKSIMDHKVNKIDAVIEKNSNLKGSHHWVLDSLLIFFMKSYQKIGKLSKGLLATFRSQWNLDTDLKVS